MFKNRVYIWNVQIENISYSILFVCLTIHSAFSQKIEEHGIPILIERAIKENFQQDFLMSRLEDITNRGLQAKLNIENFPIFNISGNYYVMSMTVKPVEELWGIPLENYCVVEVKKPIEFFNTEKGTYEYFNFNDSLFSFSNKFLVHYQVLTSNYPFKVSLDYVSGDIPLSHSTKWLDSLVNESEWNIGDYIRTATLYLKFRIFAFDATKPRPDVGDAKNNALPYWSYSINKIGIANGKSCEARVYKGYDSKGYNYIELIYYTTNPPKEFIKNSFNDENIYKVVLPITGGIYKLPFFPRYELLSNKEKNELIRDGKFYRFFHKTLKLN